MAAQPHLPLRAAPLSSAQQAALPPTPLQRLARSAAAAAVAGLLLAGGPPPSLAELATVTAQQAVDSARPLKPQAVNKGRIWMLFVLGATALFGSTGACLRLVCSAMPDGAGRWVPGSGAAVCALSLDKRGTRPTLPSPSDTLPHCTALPHNPQWCWRTTKSGSPPSRAPTAP